MYENMGAEKLRDLQRKKNAEVNTLRTAGKYAQARELREEVLRVQAARDVLQRALVAEYEVIASEGISAEVRGAAAAAVSEAERILGSTKLGG